MRLVLALAALLALFAFSRAARGQSAYQFSPAATVGATSGAQAVTLTMPSGGTLSTIQVLTAGAAALDFAAAGGGSCSLTTTYAATNSCTVNVTFTPKFPGVRTGAVVLMDAGGNPIATTLLSGVGMGPLSVATAGELATIAGNGSRQGGGGEPSPNSPAINAAITLPVGVAVDGAGSVYFTDSGDGYIAKITAGNLTILANGLNSPAAILVDGAGNVYFTETGDNLVREIVAPNGSMKLIAGNGVAGSSGDSGPATSAELNAPQGLAMDASGNLYIADSGNNCIRMVSAADGTIQTVGGSSHLAGLFGDGGPAAAAEFNGPLGLAFTTDGTPTGGSLYIADAGNNRIRRAAVTNTGLGTITTAAGSGSAPGYAGDTGPALSATLNLPSAVAVDAAGDLYISDENNNVIRKVNGTTGFITTLAGTSNPGWGGDGLDANGSTANLLKPTAVAIDGSGDLFVADWLNLRVREVYGAVGRFQFKDIKETLTSPTQIQQIDNDGNAPLQISGIVPVAIAPDTVINSAVDASTTTCSTTVPMAPGGACAIGVQFRPEELGSPVNGQINVNSNSANTPVVIDLFGNSLSIQPTATTVTSSANPSAVGQTVTFTATITGYTGQLSGYVQFYDNGAVLGGHNAVSNGRATFGTAGLALGTHPITAVFTDTDGSNAGSTSAVFNQGVKQTTVLALSSNDTPAKVYDDITFTVVVSETPSGGPPPIGSISFSTGGSTFCTGSITSGIATCDTSMLGAGTYTITATYDGDTYNLAATATLTQTVNLATSATSLSVLPSQNVTLTTPVTLTATVSGNPSSTPTGTFTFMDGATQIGQKSSTTGTTSIPASFVTTGAHQLTVSYSGDSDYASSTSAALTETVNKVATSAAVASSANPSDAGATVRFTVTVTAASVTTPNIALTGAVTLMDGATAVGTGTLAPSGTGPATASAVISVTSLAIGSHSITAVYTGDTNYLASTSGVFSQTVNQATSSNLLTASTTAPIATRPVTLTATLSSNGGTPAGTVTFLDGGTAIGTGNLVNGIASMTTATLAVGPHTITAVYGGDTNDGASTSNAVTVTVQPATTKVGLTPSQSPTNFGQPFTLTAAVTGNGGVPGGSVTFSDGGTAIQTVPLSNGSAAYTTSALGVGSHTFTASYSGDANDTASSSAPLTVQVLETLTLVVTSPSPNPSVARSNVHFVATITAQQGIQPTGSVTFFDNGVTPLGTGVINGTTATFDTAALTVGTHQIIASYAGDGNTAAMNSAPYTQIVNAAGVTVTLASSANPATFGSLLTFTATAAGTNGSLTGTVNFQDGGVTIGSAPLSSTGVATFSTSTLSPGAHPIVAAYQGDANDQPASSSTLQQVVERATSVALASSQNPMLTLAPVTITATVGNGGGAAPTGTVSFAQDGVAVSTAPVTGSGTATLQVPSLSAGTHSFVATYSGDAVDLASASTPLSEVVQLRGTTDTLTTSASSLTGGQQLTLISVVKWTGATTPTGSVTFFNGTNSLATAAVDPTGVATVTVLLSGSSANLSSTYSGDANYAPSTSGTELVTIGPAPDFAMAATPPAFTLVTKQHEMVTLTFGSMKDFTDTLSLGCLGLPQAATCSFSKDQIVLAPGATQSVTLTVDTGDPLLAGTQARNEGPSSLTGKASKLVMACFLPGGLLLGLLGMRSRRLKGFRGMGMLLVLAGLSAAAIGCGTVNQASTPAGTYNFDVTATGKTGVTQTLPLTMTVTQ